MCVLYVVHYVRPTFETDYLKLPTDDTDIQNSDLSIC